jgi:hypothetical protein
MSCTSAGHVHEITDAVAYYQDKVHFIWAHASTIAAGLDSLQQLKAAAFRRTPRYRHTCWSLTEFAATRVFSARILQVAVGNARPGDRESADLVRRRATHDHA